jgi:signal peptidase I
MTILWLLVGVAFTGFAAYDADRRGRSWYLWSRVVFFFGIFGFLGWMLWGRRGTSIEKPQMSTLRQSLLMLSGVPLTVAAVMAALVITTNVIQVARVEGQAMAPTLADQQRVFVNKLAYRLGDPARGDVVMHYYPLNPEKMFVKRVIAEAGDVVRIVDGRVYVNDAAVDDRYVPADFRSHDDWGPQVIPEGYYFVLGDHRNNSSDSRHWGMVPKRYILGRVMGTGQ